MNYNPSWVKMPIQNDKILKEKKYFLSEDQVIFFLLFANNLIIFRLNLYFLILRFDLQVDGQMFHNFAYDFSLEFFMFWKNLKNCLCDDQGNTKYLC